MIVRIMMGVMFLFCSIIPCATAATTPTEDQKAVVTDKINAAVDAAQAWLAIIDNEHYEESWNQAAQFFKDRVPEEQWESTMRQVRPPFGKALSRTVAHVQYLTVMPGSPAGEYVFIQFKTEFEHNSGAVETITPMLGQDGQWHVSGYVIK